MIIRQSCYHIASRGLWKLNNCFLTEPEYIDPFNTNVNKWVEEATTLDDTRMQWDYIKIRNASVLYGKKGQEKDIRKINIWNTN